jgi:hypothetical protein
MILERPCPPVSRAALLEEPEIEIAPTVSAFVIDLAVDQAEKPIDCPYVDQLLQHPGGHAFVFVPIAIWRLDANKRQHAIEHHKTLGAIVEIHGQRYLV